MYPPVNNLARVRFTEVAGCGDYYDASGGEFLHLAAEWVVPVRVNGRCSQAQVDHSDVVRRSVLQNPIETLQQPRCLAGPVVAEHFDVDQPCVGGYAFVGTV